jgi:hypothetical protein
MKAFASEFGNKGLLVYGMYIASGQIATTGYVSSLYLLSSRFTVHHNIILEYIFRKFLLRYSSDNDEDLYHSILLE